MYLTNKLSLQTLNRIRSGEGFVVTERPRKTPYWLEVYLEDSIVLVSIYSAGVADCSDEEVVVVTWE